MTNDESEVFLHGLFTNMGVNKIGIESTSRNCAIFLNIALKYWCMKETMKFLIDQKLSLMSLLRQNNIQTFISLIYSIFSMISIFT